MPAVLPSIRADAELRYPQEACGVALGPVGSSLVEKAVALKNISPHRDRFAFDDLEFLKLLQDAYAEGQVEKVVYHSHPDAEAYLSAIDREGLEFGRVVSQTVQLVVSVRRGLVNGMSAFRYRPGRGFEERTL